MNPFACTPADGKADDVVARAHRRAVDDAVALDDPDAGRREVELALAVDARQLGRLAADQRDARSPADLGGPLDQLGDLLELELGGGDVVEQDQRLGAAGDHVVDAVRGHVGAAGAQRAASPRDDRLRPDRVGRGGEQAVLVERVEPGEGAEPARAGRLDGGAQPLDDPCGRRKRDPGGGVRPVVAHAASLRPAPERQPRLYQGLSLTTTVVR